MLHLGFMLGLFLARSYLQIQYLHGIYYACSTPSSGLVPHSLSIVSGPQAKPNESVLAEAIKSSKRRRVYLQLMTWFKHKNNPVRKHPCS